MRTWLWLGVCAAIFAPRAYLAVADQGMIWADEIFQTLEQGHRLAFGYGLVPWEFKVGARSWLLPGAIGGVMKMLALCGVSSGVGLAVGLKLCFALLSTLALFPMLRMAYAAGGLTCVLVLGFVAAGFPASLIYGSRAMTEVACAPFLTSGLWLLWPWGLGTTGRAAWRTSSCAAAPWWKPAPRLLGAGVLLGIATVLRYQNGLLLPVVFVVVAWRRDLRAAFLVAAGAALAGMLGGLLDWVTWGRPFQAVIAYVRFNLIEGGASQWGVAKRGFYLHTMLASNGPLLLLLGLGFLAGLRRTWPTALLVLVFLAAHSAVPHKELRFLFPVLPLFLLCSAVGMARFLDKLPYPRRHRIAAVVAAGSVMLALFGWRARHVTFTDVGQMMESAAFGGPTSTLVWRGFDERNRLFSQAGTHADLCGLAAPAMNAYWTGAYTYLHRRAPILWLGGRGDYDAANYVVLGPRQQMDDARYQVVAVRGPYRLYRREGGCARPPHFSLGYGRMTPSGVPGT
jgi:phosphatidylinositol glycan class B